MDLRQLEVLRELGERGSVAAVAEALFVTPSAVSQQLAALQRGVAAPLTEKQGRRLVLTDAGRALAIAATDVAAAYARARNAVDSFVAEPAATVRVAAFQSAARTFFPPLLAGLDPADGLAVECGDEDVAQADFPMLTARYEIVVAHRPLHGAAWPATVTVVPLLREPLDVALPAAHPLVAHERLTVADVADQPWITVHEGFPLEGAIDAIAVMAERPLRVVHRINEFSVAAALVAAGAGLALLPRFTAPSEPGIVLRPLDAVPLGRRIDLLIRPDRAVRRPVARVSAALQQIATQLSG